MEKILSSIPDIFKGYVGLIKDSDLIYALQNSGNQALKLGQGIREERFSFRYSKDKWSIAEVLGHVIDTERVFSYRALCFSRNDKTKLPAFDENKYAIESNYSNRPISSIMLEMQNLRTSTLDLFNSFNMEMMNKKGIAGSIEMSVMALGYIIAGHQLHHCKIIKERYLNLK